MKVLLLFHFLRKSEIRQVHDCIQREVMQGLVGVLVNLRELTHLATFLSFQLRFDLLKWVSIGQQQLVREYRKRMQN